VFAGGRYLNLANQLARAAYHHVRQGAGFFARPPGRRLKKSRLRNRETPQPVQCQTRQTFGLDDAQYGNAVDDPLAEKSSALGTTAIVWNTAGTIEPVSALKRYVSS